MPVKSKQQFKLMQAAAHDPEVAKKVGMKQSDAAEYTKENVGNKSYSNLPFKKTKKAMGK